MMDDVYFYVGEREVLKLTHEGMYYHGELVKDAGEAHQRFLGWMAMAEREARGQNQNLDS